jgi:hypothetical protein
MGVVWIGLAVAVVAAVVAVVRLTAGGRSSPGGDMGSVSESWLSEERSRKDS